MTPERAAAFREAANLIRQEASRYLHEDGWEGDLTKYSWGARNTAASLRRVANDIEKMIVAPIPPIPELTKAHRKHNDALIKVAIKANAFVPMETVIASLVFAKAKMAIGVRGLAMYVEREQYRVNVRFETEVYYRNFGFSISFSDETLIDSKNRLYTIEAGIAEGWRNFLCNIDNWAVAEFLQLPIKIGSSQTA